MSFASDLAAFSGKLQKRANDVFVGTAIAVKDSVVNGSPITGAPGQPVDTGALKNSWQLTFESPTSALVASGGDGVESYNRVIEDNLRGAKLRSAVGGFHSVALTVAGFDKLVAAEVAKVNG